MPLDSAPENTGPSEETVRTSLYLDHEQTAALERLRLLLEQDRGRPVSLKEAIQDGLRLYGVVAENGALRYRPELREPRMEDEW